MTNNSRRGTGSERTYRTTRGYALDREDDNGRAFSGQETGRRGHRSSERNMSGRERYGSQSYADDNRRGSYQGSYEQDEYRDHRRGSRSGTQYQSRGPGYQRSGGSYYEESPRRYSGRQDVHDWGESQSEHPLSRYANDEQHTFERGGRRPMNQRYSENSPYRSSGRAYSQLDEDERSDRDRSSRGGPRMSNRQNTPQSWYADEDLWDDEDMETPRYSGAQRYNEDDFDEDEDSNYRGSSRSSSNYRY